MLILLFLFVGLQLGVGFWAARSIRSEDDFLVAGRRLGPVLAAASIFATWFGAESCVGAAGAAYAHGIGPTTTEPFAYGLCLVLMGVFFAARLWRLRITTLADFFGVRFGASTERLAAVLLLPSSLLWAAAQIRAFGHVVAVNSSGVIDVDTGVAIAAGIAVVYTVAGGLLADVYTDVVQGLLLVAGIAVLAVVAYGAFQALPADAAPPPPRAPEPTDFWTVLESWAVPICGSVVAQEAISRSLAARSASTAASAAVIGGLLYLAVGTVPLLLGWIGPALAPGLDDAETILPHLSQQLLPAALNLLFAGALIAAILSTVDSCLLVVASVVARNLVPHHHPTNGASAGRLGLARWSVAGAGLIAYGLARSNWNVKELVEEASGFGSAGVFVLAVVGLYGRSGRALAANLTLLAGLSTWLGTRCLFAASCDHPYLTSLGAAGLAFVIGRGIESRRGVPAPPPPLQSPS